MVNGQAPIPQLGPLPGAHDVEEVYVVKVSDSGDSAIVLRGNGDLHMVEKSVGCSSLWIYEGRTVTIHSPGAFSEAGSRLIIPDIEQDCAISDSRYLGTR